MNIQKRCLRFVILVLTIAFPVNDLHSQDMSELSRDSGIASLLRRSTSSELKQALQACLSGKLSSGLPTINSMAERGDQDAIYVLGRFYLAGMDSKPQAQAIDQLTSNAENGHTLSMFVIGNFSESEQPAVAMSWYQQAAEAGEELAFLKLGDIAENGRLGTRSNFELAVSYYRQAADAGLAAGDYQLARCLDTGLGISASPVESTRYYRKAALAGIVPANTQMANRYADGKGVEADPVAAIGWMIRGVQLGSTEAMVMLGKQYETGQFIKRDYNIAGQMYSSAAKQNDPQGKHRLALLYLNGIGTNPDPVRAYVLLNGAQSIPEAKRTLDELTGKLTEQQLSIAKQKIAESQRKN